MSETRQRLLEAATAEFAREGYAGANINRISETAGYAKGTVYNYFPSKRALMLALIDDIAETHLAFITERLAGEAAPAGRLERFYAAGFAFVSSHLAQARVMISTLYGSDTGFRRHMYEAYQPMFQLVGTQIVAPGVESGDFRPVEPAETAVLLMTIYLGTASQLDDEGRIWLRPERVADFALRSLRNGSAADGAVDLEVSS